MTSPFEKTEFVDRDLEAGRVPRALTASLPAVTPSGASARPPTRQELEARAGETQHRIAELKRAQEDLERERVALEEARRRRAEFETGRAETLNQLTRGIGLLEKAEFDSRRDAEQMARTLAGFKEALAKLEAINEQTWTTETWNTELTRALTTIENARMEWNAARLKWALLEGMRPAGETETRSGAPERSLGKLADCSFLELCRIGLAFTWPLATIALLGLIVLGLLLLRR